MRKKASVLTPPGVSSPPRLLDVARRGVVTVFARLGREWAFEGSVYRLVGDAATIGREASGEARRTAVRPDEGIRAFARLVWYLAIH